MRKRVQLSGLAFCVAIAAGVLAALSGGESALGLQPEATGRAASLERRIGPGVEIALSRETGFVRFVGTAPRRPIPPPPGLGAAASPGAVARAFLDAYGREFGLEGGASALRATGVSAGPAGDATVRLRQEIDGVPVLAGELAVVVDPRGNIRSVAGEVEPDRVDTTAEVGATEARRIAVAATARGRGRGAAGLRTTEPQLAIYDTRLLGGPGLDTPTLVWRTEVSSPRDPTLRQLVLVDAKLGVATETIDLVETAKDRRVCDAEESESRYPCEAPYDREEGDGATGHTDIDAAFDFAGDTYDFFSGRFGRDSLDGEGLPLVSTVRFCVEEEGEEECPYQNAFWDGEQMVYGAGFAAADDVVGHELSHGFTQFTSNLFYWFQSGAINESMSDVFGEYMDLTNGAGDDSESVRWLVGEDIPGIGAIRDMQDPPSDGDPDRMTSSLYVADPNQLDNGGVHTNSGVNNKAAYLIADGDTFNGTTVTGIGIDKAARVYYEAESSLLTSGSDYADLYEALQQACTNAIGGPEGITPADCQEVTDAVDATEMNLQPPAAPTPEAPVCGEDENAVDLFYDDLENTASGNWSHSALSGEDGWYYPQNPNPFAGFDATYATSGKTNFWGYNVPSTSDFAIAQTSDVTVPSGDVYLRFDHSYAFEDGKKDYDGGQLEYSVDGGSTWLDAESLFTHNGYNGTIAKKEGNPLEGQNAFTAESNGYISSRVALSSLSGEDVRFRFRIATDPIVDDYGWFVDDVRIYSCEEAEPPPDETPPAAPTPTATEPPSPANDNAPEVKGSAEPGSTVHLYTAATTSDCDPANLQATGSAAAFESPGLTASVTEDSTTTFRATAEDAAGNVSACSSSSIQYVEDSTPPANPTLSSPSHTVEVPSGDQTVEIAFSGAADSLSGLDGYSFEWDTSPGTLPDTVKDAEQDATGTTSPSLADGSSNYFHLRTRDNAGNWSAAVHLGPFAIDTTAPAAPTLTATEPPSPANDNAPEVKGSAEPGSTVHLYTAATTSDCDPANLQATGSAAAFESPGLTASVTEDSTTTFRATAEDAAGNVSACSSSSIQYVEDSTPPETMIVAGPAEGATIDDPTPIFSFASNEEPASFACRFDADPFAPCSGSGFSSSPGEALADGPHVFEVRATDEAGNTDESPAVREFTLDTSVPEPPPGPEPEPEPEPAPEPESAPEPNPEPARPVDISPPPVFPSVPGDATPPVVRLAAPRGQAAGGAVGLQVRCDEECRVVAWGRVVVWQGGQGRTAQTARRRVASVGLRKVGRWLTAGQAATLRLRPRTRKAARRLQRFVGRGWRARAIVSLRSVDRYGNGTGKRVVVALRPRRR